MTAQLCPACQQPLPRPRVLCARCAHPITSHEINRAGKLTHCYRISPHGRCPCQEFTPPKETTT